MNAKKNLTLLPSSSSTFTEEEKAVEHAEKIIAESIKSQLISDVPWNFYQEVDFISFHIASKNYL